MTLMIKLIGQNLLKTTLLVYCMKRQKKGLQTNTLEKNQWDAIDMKLFDKYGKRYTREKLKQKYNRLMW